MASWERMPSSVLRLLEGHFMDHDETNRCLDDMMIPSGATYRKPITVTLTDQQAAAVLFALYASKLYCTDDKDLNAAEEIIRHQRTQTNFVQQSASILQAATVP